MTTTKLALGWKLRCKKNKQGNRIWETRDELYRVTESRWVFGVELKPIKFTAWARTRIRDRDDFVLTMRPVSRHRTIERAKAACLAHFRKERDT